jgi:hypothetical protein
MKAALPIAMAAALGSMGCAPQAPEHYEGRACANVAEFPVGTQLGPVGGIDGWSISATPGVMSCSEPVPDAWGCVFSGPASVRVSSVDPASPGERLYVIADGQMGAVTVNRGRVSCSLRSAQ